MHIKLADTLHGLFFRSFFSSFEKIIRVLGQQIINILIIRKQNWLLIAREVIILLENFRIE